jgi:hypothetical protein
VELAIITLSEISQKDKHCGLTRVESNKGDLVEVTVEWWWAETEGRVEWSGRDGERLIPGPKVELGRRWEFWGVLHSKEIIIIIIII